MDTEITSEFLNGEVIKEVFNNADDIADLHACLTSPRGDVFRIRLMHALETPLDQGDLERLRQNSGINEYSRHLNRILNAGLATTIETDEGTKYVRTELGEKAINATKSLVRRVGDEAAKTIFGAALGPNSIRFFLRIYGNQREPDWETLQIRYTAVEIGRMSLFLPRSIEGLSAIDKLSEAELLIYRDSNDIYAHATRSRSFYQYLRDLHDLATENHKEAVRNSD